MGRFMMDVSPIRIVSPIQWDLPPSKSHMIRWLVLSLKADRDIIIKFKGIPGRDIISAKNCLKKLGKEIEEYPSYWKILSTKRAKIGTNIVLDCGNSGTTVNFLTAVIANMGVEITIDGDESLRTRDFSQLNNSLRSLGCEISSNKVPFTILGPIKYKKFELESKVSSQPLSAMILASPFLDEIMEIDINDERVSRGYVELTKNLAESCGIEIIENKQKIIINAKRFELPEIIEIPQESSLIPIALLLSELHGVNLQLPYDKDKDFLYDGITMLKEKKYQLIDLTDYSDFVTPVCALLAIKNGGMITGISHARGKETDRIENTKNLLNDFGMICEIIGDEITITGSQMPIMPKKPVQTYNDHRIAMTAIVLATYSGGKIVNPEISAVTHPEFLDKIKDL